MSKSKQVKEAEKNEIRRLLEKVKMSDKDIMKKLEIKRASYYRYKTQIDIEDIDIWQQKRSEPLERQANRVIKSIDDCIETAEEIRIDKNVDPRVRQEAAKLKVDAELNRYRFLVEGPNGPNVNIKVIEDSTKRLEHKSNISN